VSSGAGISTSGVAPATQAPTAGIAVFTARWLRADLVDVFPFEVGRRGLAEGRPLAVNLACLWLFIRSPESVAGGLDNPSFPNQGRMNNLLERHS
jgi:hypothetical protein